MNRNQLFPQPDFILEFKDWKRFKGASIGITGCPGVLGDIMYKRFAEAGIKITAYPDDISDVVKLSSWFRRKQFSHFFHFAAIVPIPMVERDPLKAFEVNAIGYFNLCKQLIITQKKCWSFFPSSSHIYKPAEVSPPVGLTEGSSISPSDFYGKTKYTGDMVARYLLGEFNMSYCVGRIFSFSHFSQQKPFLVPALINKINGLSDGETLHVINPDSIRDIMDAESVIDAVLCLAGEKYNGIINIGSGVGLSIRQIAEFLIKKLNRHLLITGEKKSEPNSLVADVAKLREIMKNEYKIEKFN